MKKIISSIIASSLIAVSFFGISNQTVFASEPVLIGTCHQFYDAIISEGGMDLDYILTADLDCTDAGLMAENDNTALGGYSFMFDGDFIGSLNGDGHTITVEFESDTNNQKGLFGSITDGSISDLTIEGTMVIFLDEGEFDRYGFLAGRIDSNSYIDNITVNGTIEVDGPQEAEAHTIYTTNIGLVSGSFFGSTAENIETSGSIHSSFGGAYFGGLFGSSGCSSVIDNVSSSATISASYVDQIGGISGSDGCEGPGSDIFNAHFSGTIVGDDSLGGIVGRAGVSEIYNVSVSADASIQGDRFIGGVVGEMYGGIINQSYSDASLEGSEHIGGFIGYAGGGLFIENSYATGDVTATGEYVGGFVGTTDTGTLIINAYARGNVEGNYNAGGFTGFNMGTVYYTYATGNVNGYPESGGYGGHSGYNGSDTIISSFATGNVTVSDTSFHTGGFVGRNDDYSIINSAWVIGTHPYAVGADYLTGEGQSRELLSQFDESNFDEESDSVFKNANYVMYNTEIDLSDENHEGLVGSLVWDFENIWTQDNSVNNGFPYLRWSDLDSSEPEPEPEPVTPPTPQPRRGGSSGGFSPIIAQQNNQSQITQLLEQIKQLQALLAQLQGKNTSQTSVPEACKSTTLRQGMRGQCVRVLQQLLNVNPVTGTFGPITLQAVRQYQQQNNLTADGIVGRQTWGKF